MYIQKFVLIIKNIKKIQHQIIIKSQKKLKKKNFKEHSIKNIK